MSAPVWNTPQGNIGAFASNSDVSVQLSASPVSPSLLVRYSLIVGRLPEGLSLSTDGLISGRSPAVTTNQTVAFVVRATDENGNLRDRTFNLSVTGIATPSFVTPAGEILKIPDSTWVEYQIEYVSPEANTIIGLVQGQLPNGLEINDKGVIRGYASPPVVNFSLGPVSNAVINIQDNVLIGYSTSGYRAGRPITFSGNVFGGLIPGVIYYIREVINTTNFTISATVNGPALTLENDNGYMVTNLSSVTLGQPTIQSFTFSLLLTTPNLDDITRSFTITVVNQNAPSSIGGLGLPFNTRVPALLNTRPETFDIEQNQLDFRYYLLPDDSGRTYLPTEEANLRQVASNNQFSFRLLGVDFDNNELEYEYFDLPLGLQGDPVTGWIKGNPIVAANTINRYVFSARAYKKTNPVLSTPTITFALVVRNNLTSEIIWNTDNDLGVISNGVTSTLKIQATSSVPLRYFLIEGELPPNLTLTDNGEIIGKVSFQPNTILKEPDTETIYNFRVRAYSPEYAIISSERTFSLTVRQLFPFPTDTLYATCTPDVESRSLIASLLTNTTLIPEQMLYRPDDINFGKANKVVYEHLFGVLASGFDEYIAAIARNHYKKRVTLGEIKTAIARNQDTNEIIYEVVYSSVIDDLVNPDGVSVNKNILWPRAIPNNPSIVYPNSLENMRVQVQTELGSVNNTNLLPLWMTTQQENGSTLGFVPAWVICYTKPGYAQIVKNNIETKWKNEIGRINKLNQIDFLIDRFTVGKSTSFNYDNNLEPPAWTSLPGGTPVPEPITENDFYIIFPQTNILPSSSNPD